MGFNNTATTITLTAKFTPYGRQLMVSTSSNLIQTFSLGDSDANYYTTLELETGDVPATSGDIGANNTTSNSTYQNYIISSFLIQNGTGAIRKAVSSQSSAVLTENIANGFVTVSGSNLTYNTINSDDYATDKLVNLFASFNLPLNTVGITNYTGVTYNNGGFSDTALSGFGTNKILAIAINDTTYGECIDGKTVKLELPTSAGTYTIYSTFQSDVSTLSQLDASISDSIGVISRFGSNVVALVSDNIMKPNGGDASLSWATGYGQAKPYSLGNKQTFNLQTNSNLAVTADTLVGLAYLDKGFVVITNPTILANYNSSYSGVSATTIGFDSVSTSVSQNITCILDRGEFGTSTNTSFEYDDIPRFTEVGLYDASNNLIAVAKTDRQITKNINDFLALGVKITL
jgi:hypothetical protein